MAISSTRRIINRFAGPDDTDYFQEVNEATSSDSPAASTFVNLTSGNNSISVPTGSIGCTIIPPAGNIIVLTLKGVNGDTGILIALADPTSIGLASGVSSFVINAASAVTNVRLIWS